MSKQLICSKYASLMGDITFELTFNENTNEYTIEAFRNNEKLAYINFDHRDNRNEDRYSQWNPPLPNKPIRYYYCIKYVSTISLKDKQKKLSFVLTCLMLVFLYHHQITGEEKQYITASVINRNYGKVLYQLDFKHMDNVLEPGNTEKGRFYAELDLAYKQAEKALLEICGDSLDMILNNTAVIVNS